MAVPDAAELQARLMVAEAAARAAGRIQRQYYGTNVAFEAKSSAQDLLTRADTEGQEAAAAVIARAFPGERIIGEEDGLEAAALSEAIDGDCWLIDPLDGTQSYVHDFPIFGPGVSFVSGRRSQVGVVYLPVYEEMFTAARGLGSSLNGAPISVARRRSLAEALLAVHIRDVSPRSVEQFLATTGRVLPAAHGVRLLGSPMISLAYVACGRLDCAATLSPSRLWPWDHAPAVVILEEAGGVVAAPDGAPFDLMQPGIAGASSDELLQELIRAASA